jgi:dienelactone hydrolase
MGLIVDQICTLFARCFIFNVNSRRFFADGFGDIHLLAEVDAFMRSLVNGTTHVQIPSVEMRLKTDNEYEDKVLKCESYNCSFTSPASGFLPETVHTAFFRFIKPPKNRSIKGIIIILPHTGDEWYDHRKNMMRDLVEDGYAAIIPMVPFYGTRRGPKQHLHFVRTVELFVKASAAAAIETAAIVQWVHQMSPDVKVCVAGVSYGGSLASYTACIVHEPISIVTVVGTDSGCSMISGPLATQIAWSALVGERDSLSHVKEELFSIFSTRSVSDMVSHRRKAALHSAVCVSAKYDAFINAADSRLLHSAIRRISHTTVDWVAGGHITSVFINPASNVVPSILCAFAQSSRVL